MYEWMLGPIFLGQSNMNYIMYSELDTDSYELGLMVGDAMEQIIWLVPYKSLQENEIVANVSTRISYDSISIA